MPDLLAHVANCLIHGELITDLGKRSLNRDTVTFNCQGRKFIVTQKPEVINNPASQFTGRFSETTQILVPNVAKSDVPEVLACIDRICWLLSFACQSKVGCSRSLANLKWSAMGMVTRLKRLACARMLLAPRDSTARFLRFETGQSSEISLTRRIQRTDAVDQPKQCQSGHQLAKF